MLDSRPNTVLQFPINMRRYAEQHSASRVFASGLRGDPQTAEIIEFPHNELAKSRAAIRDQIRRDADAISGCAFPDFGNAAEIDFSS